MDFIPHLGGARIHCHDEYEDDQGFDGNSRDGPRVRSADNKLSLLPPMQVIIDGLGISLPCTFPQGSVCLFLVHQMSLLTFFSRAGEGSCHL